MFDCFQERIKGKANESEEKVQLHTFLEFGKFFGDCCI